MKASTHPNRMFSPPAQVTKCCILHIHKLVGIYWVSFCIQTATSPKLSRINNRSEGSWDVELTSSTVWALMSVPPVLWTDTRPLLLTRSSATVHSHSRSTLRLLKRIFLSRACRCSSDCHSLMYVCVCVCVCVCIILRDAFRPTC